MTSEIDAHVNADKAFDVVNDVRAVTGAVTRRTRAALAPDALAKLGAIVPDPAVIPIHSHVTEPRVRKMMPIISGCLHYFPDALAYVAYVSYRGNEQHNPGQPLHWARGKSMDHADAAGRHLAAIGTLDLDKVRHAGKLAWRALALLQHELEQAYNLPAPPNATET